MSSDEKAKIVDRGSLCNTAESTGSNVQYEPYLFSVACSKTELSISGKFGRSGKGSFSKKLKSFKELPYILQVKEHVLSFYMILISLP